MPKQRDWSWWSEAKLGILRDYLRAFAIASKRAQDRIYLDLFAGSYDNQKRDEEGRFPGSSQIAFNIEPAFTRLALFEQPDKARTLELSIQSDELHKDRCWEIFSGDCNDTIDEGLGFLKYRLAPTFAFLDPCGLQVNWTTLEKLARWKNKDKPKIELLILFPEPALPRVIGAEVKKIENNFELVNKVYGSKVWGLIYQRRVEGSWNASRMRQELINLYRWRLESILQYKKTHAIGIGDNNIPLYTLIFATDHPAGDQIMEHIYKTYSGKIIPMMQAEANIIRQRNKGQDTLEGMDPEVESLHPTITYVHFKPWTPPQVEGEVYFDWITEMSPSLPFAWSED